MPAANTYSPVADLIAQGGTPPTWAHANDRQRLLERKFGAHLRLADLEPALGL
jgi:hypothetical protein